MGILILLVTIPGYPFAALLRRLGVNMGPGCGHIMFHLYAGIFGIAFWVFVLMGGIWAWQHLAVAVR